MAINTTTPAAQPNQPNKWGLPAASILGGIGTMFGLGGGQSPQQAASPYMEQIRQDLPGYYEPYMEAGLGALPQLQQQYGQLTSDPGGFLNQLGQGFQQSPGTQYAIDQAVTAGNRAASAGGMLGTPAAAMSVARQAQGIGQQDYNTWLNNAMGLYGQGQQGLENLYGTGFQASTGLGGNLANLGLSEAQMAYQNQAAQNQAQGQGIGGIVSGLGSLFGLF